MWNEAGLGSWILGISTLLLRLTKKTKKNRRRKKFFLKVLTVNVGDIMHSRFSRQEPNSLRRECGGVLHPNLNLETRALQVLMICSVYVFFLERKRELAQQSYQPLWKPLFSPFSSKLITNETVITFIHSYHIRSISTPPLFIQSNEQ